MVNENKGTVQGRLDRAFFKKGKEFSSAPKESTTKKAAVLDGDDFESFLDFGDEEVPRPKKPSQKRSSSSLPTYQSKKQEYEMDYSHEDHSILSARQEEIEDPQQTSFSEESMIETPKRNLMNEYDTSIPPATNSLDEEEALRLLDETPADEVLDDDALMEIVDAETTQKPLFDSHSTENEENIEKVLEQLKEGMNFV